MTPSDVDKRIALEMFINQLCEQTPVNGPVPRDRLATRSARSEAIWAVAAGRLNAAVTWGERGGLDKSAIINAITLIYGGFSPQLPDYTNSSTTNPER